MGEEKAKHRAKLIAEIDALEQEIIRTNKVACEQGRNLTADEFANFPPVIYKEWLISKQHEKYELLHKFFPPPQVLEDDPDEELLY